MILGGRTTVLFGENSFERTAKLAKIKQDAQKSGFLIEQISADKLTRDEFISAVGGMSLLAEKRLVIVRNLSENSEIWSGIVNLLARVSADIHLCLVEDKLDRRVKVFKELAKIADIQEFKLLTAKDGKNVAELARALAKRHGLSLDNKTANFLVEWVGVDEWAVRSAVERLAILGEITEVKIREYIPQNIEANAFEILEMAIRGEQKAIIEAIERLKIQDGNDGAYQFFGLISSQVFNLMALKIGRQSGVSTQNIATKIGANAWALGKMELMAARISSEEMAKIVEMLAKTDEVMKNGSGDNWAMIEAVLLNISTGKK